jgi:hypothetical protein
MKKQTIPRKVPSVSFVGVIAFMAVIVGLTCISILIGQTQQPTGDRSQRDVAAYVRDRILGGNFGDRTLWMTPGPIDQSYVVKDLILDRKLETPVPYPKAWLVMIDDHPKANFAHDVRWVFIDDQLTKHTEPVQKDFPPLVLPQGGKGEAVPVRCVPGVTPTACEATGPLSQVAVRPSASTSDSCLYAVLVSGGINSSSNYSRYPQNLKSMYSKLRGCGYPASHIYVYYANGSALDCDNADGDNNDATGSDVTGGADEGLIRARIQTLCKTLNKDRDVLFTYFTNHGADDAGACLWDGNNNGLEASEIYSPAEFAADTANCSVCRHFSLHDQCFSGEFLPIASDGNHANLAVYASANDHEYSWGREYMAQWEKNDPGATTMNAMHQDVVANGHLTSTPGMAEGTAGLGNVSPCKCCRYWPWWYWLIIIIIIVIIIIVIIIIIRRKKVGPRPPVPNIR